jgi:hypothetical protein
MANGRLLQHLLFLFFLNSTLLKGIYALRSLTRQPSTLCLSLPNISTIVVAFIVCLATSTSIGISLALENCYITFPIFSFRIRRFLSQIV